MLFRLSFLLVFLIVSCSSSKRPDIVFEDFESGDFGKWNKLGVAFDKPCRIDSVSVNIKNAQGSFFAFSNFEGEGESHNQGKLVSKNFIIDRKYIRLLVAGGKHDTRECINLIVNNKIVRVASGENDNIFRKVIWDVDDLQGESAVIEIVDAMITEYTPNTLPHILVDNIVFSDFKDAREEVFEDFESGSYGNWKVEGEAFEVPRNRTNVYYPLTPDGFNGKFFAFSFGETHDTKQGKLTSKTFTIKYDGIKFLVGGGRHPNKTCINLLVNDSIVFSQTGQNDGQLRWKQWDVTPFKGQKARIEILDHFSGGWGHIMVDDIIFFNKPVPYNIWIYLVVAVIAVVIGILLLRRYIFHLRKGSKVKVSEVEMEKFEKVKASIEESGIYKDQNLSIDQILEVAGESEENINMLFDKIGRTSLTNYLNYLRVEEFKRLLKDPNNEAYTMMYLAEKSGFSSKTSFYRVFKAVTNRTPSEYKKSLGQ
ncbi:AraC family transcriptional regulator [Arenibacter aquaticus]|uniref:AraC family transcriptional regulator n=1 Tax=Arenibacter aquaticus TaxID=2489054 RepID=A0A3S0BXL7_9FLAO|nr:AraC family transcriptional regulator [Arenibacter aquaticus]RTE53968.1 AraC family transcriptional regulator [Arenibacter aquaticus]